MFNRKKKNKHHCKYNIIIIIASSLHSNSKSDVFYILKKVKILCIDLPKVSLTLFIILEYY